MICFRCRRPVPEVADTHFCVHCGYIVTQPCPYEEGVETPNQIPLLDEDGRPPTNWHCHGPFTRCPKCGRLYALGTSYCTKCGHTSELEEPAVPFASSLGPTNGTRSVRWPGSLQGTPRLLASMDVEEVQQLAFRYGLLVAVTRRNLLIWSWEKEGWKSRGSMTLPGNLPLQIHSLLLEGGSAFLLAADQVPMFQLARQTLQSSSPGRFLGQTCNRHWWGRIVEEGNGVALSLYNLQTRVERLIPLPLAAQDIADLAAEERFVLATRRGIFAIDPQSSSCERLPFEQIEWKRIAVTHGRVLALGVDTATDETVLVDGTSDGQDIRRHVFGRGYLPDFARCGDSIFLVGDRSIDILRASMLTQNARSIGLQAALTNQVGLLALEDDKGSVRLLLPRREAEVHYVVFIDVDRQYQATLRPALSAPPLICIADSRIVVAARTAASISTIWTHDIP